MGVVSETEAEGDRMVASLELVAEYEADRRDRE